MSQHFQSTLPALVLSVCLAACSSTPLSQSEALSDAGKAPSGEKVRQVRSVDDRLIGEISGTPAPGSKFAQIKVGMRADQVQQRIGAPNELYSHDTGKRWIPFYLGDDARRIVVLYQNEGCLIYTGGKVWGGGEHTVIRMDVDPSGACFQP